MDEKDQYAYPGPRYTQCGIKSGHGQGMTMRDWFAGQALASISETHAGQAMDPKATAKSAYVLADAMMIVRMEDDT